MLKSTTASLKPADVEKKWIVIDAQNAVVGRLAPGLKASGARTVILAGNPGANDAAFRAAGVDRFIFVRCDVLGTLRELLREEGVLQ